MVTPEATKSHAETRNMERIFLSGFLGNRIGLHKSMRLNKSKTREAIANPKPGVETLMRSALLTGRRWGVSARNPDKTIRPSLCSLCLDKGA